MAVYIHVHVLLWLVICSVVYGPILCTTSDDDSIQSAGAISLVPIVLMLLIVMTCFMNHCICARGSSVQTRAILYFFGFIFSLAFFLSVAAASYFVYFQLGFIRDSLKGKLRHSLHCQFSLILAINLFINYAVILIAIIAWIVSALYICCKWAE